jgi:hypothetical protein
MNGNYSIILKDIHIVILDIDGTNICDRPFVKLLRIYCCEWSCELPIFKKFQVRFIIL